MRSLLPLLLTVFAVGCKVETGAEDLASAEERTEEGQLGDSSRAAPATMAAPSEAPSSSAASSADEVPAVVANIKVDDLTKLYAANPIRGERETKGQHRYVVGVVEYIRSDPESVWMILEGLQSYGAPPLVGRNEWVFQAVFDRSDTAPLADVEKDKHIMIVDCVIRGQKEGGKPVVVGSGCKVLAALEIDRFGRPVGWRDYGLGKRHPEGAKFFDENWKAKPVSGPSQSTGFKQAAR